MIIIFIRSAVTFIVLLVVMRLMGKRQIGEMQPFELVITLLIAELACIPMSDISIPLVYGISAVLAVFILHQIFALIEQSGRFTKTVISGKPSVVLNKNGVDFSELKKNNLDVEDLIESMRASGYFSLDDLEYAIFESNGKLSAKEKADFSERKPSLPVLIVAEGKLVRDNLFKNGLDREKFSEIMREKNIRSIKDIEVMTLDENGKVYLQKKNEKYLTFNIREKENV